MISKAKKYFSFFGMMANAVDMQINALYSLMHQLKISTPRIEKLTQTVVLRPVQNNNDIAK
ncbi:MAG: hypothetical protein U9N30_00290 [Campylobacterota bacterium]|nr:hypothetical protein [Campylobacterota bacterium]